MPLPDPRPHLRRMLFAALYDRLARSYDTISRLAFAGEWERWQAAALRYADRQPIVEIGCGTGQSIARLRQQGKVAFGLDAAAPMLQQARRRAAGALIQAQAQRLPLRDASVGTLLSIFPTPYILDQATWREAARVLTPDGRLIIVTHGWLEPDDPLRLALALGHRLIYGRQAALAPPLPAELPPTLALIERTSHGFAAIHVATRQG